MTTNSTRMADELLAGAIDAHVHGAPDIFDRRMTVVEVAEDAAKHDMDGVILLNHFSDTTPQAAIVNSLVDDVTIKGGLKLNWPCGGLNPEAVRIAIELGAAKIDMPTQQAANELRAKGKDPSKGITVLEDGELRPEVHDILRMVSNSRATIATGHLSAKGVKAVARAALDHGISNPIVSHPTLASINLSVEEQVQLAEEGAIVEYCYINTTSILTSHFDGWEPYEPADILEQAAEVGPESVILATDFGQTSNPKPTTGLRDFITDAIEFGFTESEIAQMVKKNPHQIYNFE